MKGTLDHGLPPANQLVLSTHSVGKIKGGTGYIQELTHDVGRNSSLKLKHRDGLPSEVVQDIDLNRAGQVASIPHVFLPTLSSQPPTAR